MIEEFRELVRRVSELERRMANVIQTGTVSDVDYQTGRYRVHLATDNKGEAVKTPWIRSSELAGWAGDEDVEGVSSWTPLGKGQQVHVLSRDGDICENSWIVPAGYRDSFPQLDTDAKAHVRKIGKLTLVERSDSLLVTIGSASLKLEEDLIEIRVGDKRVVVTGDVILTDGKTRLHNGTRPAHYQGGSDSRGDRAVSGADGVLV
jgi:phage baseplate assembly protein gpV